jgi:ankyrin repeat protein
MLVVLLLHMTDSSVGELHVHSVHPFNTSLTSCPCCCSLLHGTYTRTRAHTHAQQTLLHVAAQNGNRRIAKLCLRRGAAVNTQTFNGQTALHYAFGYGFEALGEYLISKGADDSITNKQGLTCYEGLSADELSKM